MNHIVCAALRIYGEKINNYHLLNTWGKVHANLNFSQYIIQQISPQLAQYNDIDQGRTLGPAPQSSAPPQHPQHQPSPRLKKESPQLQEAKQEEQSKQSQVIAQDDDDNKQGNPMYIYAIQLFNFIICI